YRYTGHIKKYHTACGCEKRNRFVSVGAAEVNTVEKLALDQRLPKIQQAALAGKTVLVRFDHNVVKDGEIKDPYRIDRTFGTLYNIVERGGRPILMTHVGRPKNKKTGDITCRTSESVGPIVEYLEHKLHTTFHIPQFNIDPKLGIAGIDTSINLAIRNLRDHKIG